MNIVVLVKQVPDSGSERKLDPSDNTVARASADNVINEMDEYAIEEALTRPRGAGRRGHRPDRRPRLGHRRDPQGAVDGRRTRPCTSSTRRIHGSCAVQTSAVLAAALGQLEYDLILCGAEATDAQLQVMPALLAERLGIPQLSGARKLTVEGGDGEDRAADRRRLLGRRGAAAGDRVHLGHHQRAALPLVQGDHGREEEAGARPSRWPTWASTPAAWAWRTPPAQVLDFAGRPPQGRGREGHRRGRRRARSSSSFLAAQKIV